MSAAPHAVLLAVFERSATVDRRTRPFLLGCHMINSLIQFATTTISLIVFCALGVTGEITVASTYRDVIAFETRGEWGVSVGGFIAGHEYMLDHEYEHVLQARELQSAYLIMIALPSIAYASSLMFLSLDIHRPSFEP